MPGSGRKGLCCGAALLGAEGAALAAVLDDIVALGAGWVRLDFDWNAFQPTGRGDFVTARHDRVVDACARRGIRVLGIVDYRALWAEPRGADQFHPPSDAGLYGAFASALVGRYAGRVAAWEIWNEPNLGGVFWKPRADPAAYARLLRAAYPAVKAAYPGATVIAGGTAPAADDGTSLGWLRWYAELYRAGAQPFFDAVATHPYTRDLPSARDGSAYWWEQSAAVHRLLAENGDGAKAVWMTEFGLPTGGPDGGSEAKQAAIVADAFRLHAAMPWAGPLFLYEYRDSGTDPATSENFYGLLRADGSRKPAYEAFRDAGRA